MNLRTPTRLMLAALLGAATALLVSCGSSGKGLIPAGKAGPLQEDFEAVAQAASAGNGNCTGTERALGKTEQDFLALPATVDAGLHRRLEEGIANLRTRALSECIQPTGGTTGTTTTTTSTTSPATKTSTTETATTPSTTPTAPTTTSTGTQTAPTTTPTSPSSSGGTEAGGEAGAERGAPGDSGAGGGAGAENGGANVGGASPGGGQ